VKLGTLVYLKRDGRTLMIHRIRKKNDIHWGKWNTLGGKLEPGETPEECAVREVFEESGLTVRNPVMRGMLTFPAFDGEEDWYVFVMVATDFSGDPVESSPEGDLAWIEDGRLAGLELWEGDRIFMDWLDDGRFFSGKLEYDGGGLVAHSVVFHGDLQTS
jgi:8-oxo-dGTP diphosphatase